RLAGGTAGIALHVARSSTARTAPGRTPRTELLSSCRGAWLPDPAAPSPRPARDLRSRANIADLIDLRLRVKGDPPGGWCRVLTSNLLKRFDHAPGGSRHAGAPVLAAGTLPNASTMSTIRREPSCGKSPDSLYPITRGEGTSSRPKPSPKMSAHVSRSRTPDCLAAPSRRPPGGGGGN